MSRDYKSRANTQQRKRGPKPCWVWFIAGLLVGLFFSMLAWLKLPSAEVKPAVAPAISKAAPASEKEKAPSEAVNPKPRFDFFTILPEMEVVVPEPEVESRETLKPKSAETGTGAEVVTVAAADRYMLQMGSFRQYADADRLKASLALVGIQAEIQKVKIDTGELFHRVRAGPYSPEKVKMLSARLKENRINSLMIKLK